MNCKCHSFQTILNKNKHKLILRFQWQNFKTLNFTGCLQFVRENNMASILRISQPAKKLNIKYKIKYKIRYRFFFANCAFTKQLEPIVYHKFLPPKLHSSFVMLCIIHINSEWVNNVICWIKKSRQRWKRGKKLSNQFLFVFSMFKR